MTALFTRRCRTLLSSDSITNSQAIFPRPEPVTTSPTSSRARGARRAVAGRRTGIAPRGATADRKAAQHPPAAGWPSGETGSAGRRLPHLGPKGPRRRRRAFAPAADRTGNSPQRQRWRAEYGAVPSRRLLDALPYPDNLDHHFVVDPTKFDFYAMDCYRMLAEDKLAETLADKVIRSVTDFDGTERAPMRTAEARITLGVVAARQGDIEGAVHQGERTLSASRKSLPSLVMVSRDLTRVLKDRYPKEPATGAYLEQLQLLSHATDLARHRP